MNYHFIMIKKGVELFISAIASPNRFKEFFYTFNMKEILNIVVLYPILGMLEIYELRETVHKMTVTVVSRFFPNFNMILQLFWELRFSYTNIRVPYYI